MALITYADKTYLNENAEIPAVNKCCDTDMNEIKNVVNANWNAMDDYVSEVGNNYIKYNNGTMICWDKVTEIFNITAQSGSFYYITRIFSFAEAFIQAPTVTPMVGQDTGIIWAGLGNAVSQTATQTQIRIISSNSRSNATISVGYIAIGRWK